MMCVSGMSGKLEYHLKKNVEGSVPMNMLQKHNYSLVLVASDTALNAPSFVYYRSKPQTLVLTYQILTQPLRVQASFARSPHFLFPDHVAFAPEK